QFIWRGATLASSEARSLEIRIDGRARRRCCNPATTQSAVFAGCIKYGMLSLKCRWASSGGGSGGGPSKMTGIISGYGDANGTCPFVENVNAGFDLIRLVALRASTIAPPIQGRLLVLLLQVSKEITWRRGSAGVCCDEIAMAHRVE